MKKAIVIFSGGQDSTTCLFWALKKFDWVHALTFNYGQKHRCELNASWEICEMFKIPRFIINVPGVLQGTSPLINENEEVEKYESADVLPGGLEKTFVPGRNILFLTIAANIAYINCAKYIITGVSQEDFGGYPDCRKSFIDSMNHTINLGLEADIDILTPLIHKTKKETVQMAVGLGPDCIKALAYSHTCYEGKYPPCGHCHACLLRAKGFTEAGITDPLIERYKNGI